MAVPTVFFAFDEIRTCDMAQKCQQCRTAPLNAVRYRPSCFTASLPRSGGAQCGVRRARCALLCRNRRSSLFCRPRSRKRCLVLRSTPVTRGRHALSYA